jgi:hypothetical protein
MIPRGLSDININHNHQGDVRASRNCKHRTKSSQFRTYSFSSTIREGSRVTQRKVCRPLREVQQTLEMPFRASRPRRHGHVTWPSAASILIVNRLDIEAVAKLAFFWNHPEHKLTLVFSVAVTWIRVLLGDQSYLSAFAKRRVAEGVCGELQIRSLPGLHCIKKERSRLATATVLDPLGNFASSHLPCIVPPCRDNLSWPSDHQEHPSSLPGRLL